MAVKHDPGAYVYAPAELRAYRKAALKAIRKDGRALEFALAAFQADRGVVLEAAQQRGMALELASGELRAEKLPSRFCAKAIRMRLPYKMTKKRLCSGFSKGC